MSDPEKVLREVLDQQAAAYDVSPGALADLQRRTRRRGRTPRAGWRMGLAAGVAVAAVTAVAVLPTQLGGRHRAEPSRIESTAPVPTAAAVTARPSASASAHETVKDPAPPLIHAYPAAVSATATLALGFVPQRIVLAGSDAYVFGVDEADEPVAARLDLGHGAPRIAVGPLPMTGTVCSGSIDGGLLVVVEADAGDCARRGRLEVLDSVTLQAMAHADDAARGGDVLVRPEGVYDVDAGVLQLRDRVTLLVRHQRPIAPADDIVNLAGDPSDQTFAATTFSMTAKTTQVLLESRPGLDELAATELTGATEGAIAYATRDGFWVPYTGAQGDGVPRLTGPVTGSHLGPSGTAFPGIAPDSTFALSGRRLWSLDAATQLLQCADLATGDTTGATTVTHGGDLAADATHLFVLPRNEPVLYTLTPAGACG